MKYAKEKQIDKVQKPINKKIIIPISILIIIVLIGTLVVYAFNKNKENESANIAQETKERYIILQLERIQVVCLICNEEIIEHMEEDLKQLEKQINKS